MRDHLKQEFESLYRSREDPWDYWTSDFERRKYGEQISLVAQLTAPKRILEIACSTGAHTKLIHEAFPEARITAVDISETAIARAAANVDAPGVVEFHAADIFTFAETLEPRSFDAIFWSEAIDLQESCTVAEFSRLVQRLSRGLMPDGVLCAAHNDPSPLIFTQGDPASRNRRVFHELILDSFRLTLEHGNARRKTEVERTYHYTIRLYRPRLADCPRREEPGLRIDQVEVVIAAAGGADAVADLVSTIRRASRVHRVIVADWQRGYGNAVKRGVQQTECQWIFKLDADMEKVDPEWVDLLVDRATREAARLVKTGWPSARDRVTDFTVRPALRLFFPELELLKSPISGTYLFDKTAFDIFHLPDGIAFDLALLIDALEKARKISEVEIAQQAAIEDGNGAYQRDCDRSDELLTYLVEAGFARCR